MADALASNAMADRWRRLSASKARSAATECVSAEPSPEEIEIRRPTLPLGRELPDDQPQVVRLRFAHENSIREIETEMGRTKAPSSRLSFAAWQR